MIVFVVPVKDGLEVIEGEEKIRPTCCHWVSERERVNEIVCAGRKECARVSVCVCVCEYEILLRV